MSEYREVRKHHSLVEICKKPALAAEVTITAAEALGVDAAIIFADLLLPLEVMGLPFHFSASRRPGDREAHPHRGRCEGSHHRRRARVEVCLRGHRQCVKHWGNKLPMIGFCGAPFTLASYMIEGGGSRNYIEVKKMMYHQPQVWDELLRKLNVVLAAYVADQVKAGADVIQVFDSWVGCLSVEDYRRYVLPRTKELISALRKTGVPIIYFGTDSTTLLPSMNETEADVIGLDWRVPFDEGWKLLNHRPAVQGNLDPVLLFADWDEMKQRAKTILDLADSRPGHIFNLGHGILPQTPVENVKNLAKFVQEYSAQHRGAAAGSR